MGYYACTRDAKLTSRKHEHEIDIPRLYSGNIFQNGLSVSFAFDGKYGDEEVLEALQLLARQGVEGFVQFYGEDNAQWRFLLRGGGVTKQEGRVVWPDE